MRVPVAIVAGQQPLERFDEVVVGAGAGLDDRHTRRGVRDEDVAQTVSAGPAERANRVGQVDDPPTGGVDVEQIGFHAFQGTGGWSGCPGTKASASPPGAWLA